jgi:tetratricopeptide (TPR) repeat protein
VAEVVVGEASEDVVEGRRPPVVRVAVATVIDLAAAVVVVAGQLTPRALLVGLVLHLVASASLALARELPASRRSLLVAFELTLPIVGAPIALLSLVGGDHSELGESIKDEPEPEPAPEVALIREVADGLPAPDALLVASVEERRARLWALGRRADAESIALLRWALTAGPNDLGLEAALALEDLSIEFGKKLKTLRKQLEEAPTAADARAAGEHITHAFEVGALDVAQLRVYADEARGHFDRAVELEPSLAAEIAVGRARLELAILRPDLALAAIDQALPSAPPAIGIELHKLRDEAEIRSHDLPWESPSLLSTWRSFRPGRSSSGRSSSGRTGSRRGTGRSKRIVITTTDARRRR